MFNDHKISAMTLPQHVQKNIQQNVLSILNANAASNALEPGATYDALLQQLKTTSTFKITDKSRFYDALEAIFIPLAESMLGQEVAYFERPFNVRVSHSEAPNSYLDGDYPTDHLHCDPWYGEPANSVNFLYYVTVSHDSSYVEFFAVSDADKARLRSYQGPYRHFDKTSVALNTVNLAPCNGQLVMFDAYTPHNTVRCGNTVRVSIDFRVIAANCGEPDGRVTAKYASKVPNA